MEEIIKTKKCRKCGRELPVSEFNKSVRENDGLQYYCRECQSEMVRVSYQKRQLKKQLEKQSANDKVLHKVYSNPDLASFQPRELIAELRARGYSGELSYTQKIVV